MKRYLENDLLGGGGHLERRVCDGDLLLAVERVVGTVAGHTLGPLRPHVELRVDHLRPQVLLLYSKQASKQTNKRKQDSTIHNIQSILRQTFIGF